MNDFGGKQILQIAFLAVIISSIPFILIVNNKNTTIERCIKSINSNIKLGDFVAAEKSADEAYDQFGIVYQGYVASLHIFGGKYFVKSKIMPVRARVKCLAIAQLMAEGKIDLEQKIESAKECVKQASKLDTSKTFQMVEDSIPQLEKLIPFAKLCSEKNTKNVV